MSGVHKTDEPGTATPTEMAAPRRAEQAPSASGPKLLDRLREALCSRHYSRRTEQTYRDWVKRFIYFHNTRHPADMAEPEINAFLTHLAVKEKVSASTQNQALSALLFLYRHVIGREVGDLGEVIRTIQELLGHKDVSTTMVYTHVLNKGGHGVRSPVDGLEAGLYSLHKPGAIDAGHAAN